MNRKPVSAELIAAIQLAQKPIYTIRNGPNKQAMAWVNNMVGGNSNVHRVIMRTGNVGIRQWDRDLSNQRRGHLHPHDQVGAQPISKGVEILRRLP